MWVMNRFGEFYPATTNIEMMDCLPATLLRVEPFCSVQVQRFPISSFFSYIHQKLGGHPRGASRLKSLYFLLPQLLTGLGYSPGGKWCDLPGSKGR